VSDYSLDIISAEADIREAGTLCTVIIPTEGLDDNLITDDPEAATEHEGIPIVFVPLNRVDFESVRDIKNTEVEQRWEQGIMAGNAAFIPTLRTIILAPSGRSYAIKNYDRIAPNDTQNIVYLLQLVEE